jgi:hypothetical protein
MKIRFHELLHEIDLLEIIDGGGLKDIEDRNNVLMMEMAKELNLAECAQTKHGVIKRCNSLNGDLSLRRNMNGRANEPVSTDNRMHEGSKSSR